MSEKIFAKGLFHNEPREQAPDFVLGSLSIIPEEFIAFLQQRPVNSKGYVNLDILKSKGGKSYIAVNTYGLEDAKENNAELENIKPDEEEDEIPF